MIGPVNTHTSDVIQTEPVIFKSMYVNTYSHVHAIMTSEKRRGHEFEGECGGIYRNKGKGEIALR